LNEERKGAEETVVGRMTRRVRWKTGKNAAKGSSDTSGEILELS